MANQIVRVLETNFVTHNVKRFVLERPAGLTFVSGQATELSINKPALENEVRPFTFTSVNSLSSIEFMIKIYTGHNGVTEKLAKINVGDELIVHDVFGTIMFEGEGVFIAGGAGITPFISILRELRLQNKLVGNTLLFANRATEDIILKGELNELLGKSFLNILEKPEDPKEQGKRIDKDLLKQYVEKGTKHYYICGPAKFTAAMIENLETLGVQKSQIVFEQ
ncbi:MAG: FAD-binding oxidoreductase [Bacteroidia bacterium]